MKEPMFAVAVLCVVECAFTQVTERVSLDSNGVEASSGAELSGPQNAVVSADGRYVAFMSFAILDAGDSNATWDVFVRDRLAGVTERVSVDSTGGPADSISGLYGIAITPDARYVAFESRAGNLVTGDTNGVGDIFVRDRLGATTERVSIATGGLQGDAGSLRPAISPDGRFVLFASNATNLAVGDINGQVDVFLHDRATGMTELVSTSTTGLQGNNASEFSSLSADGRFVAFASSATNLVSGDTNGSVDVFLRDRQLGWTTRVSLSSVFAQGNGHSNLPCLSSDGRYIAFMSAATNLVAGDTNARDDVFVRDRLTNTTERVSVGFGGTQGDGHSTEPSFSTDARYLAFKSSATNLVPGGPTAFTTRIFVRDRLTGSTEIASLATDGTDPSNGGCGDPSISGDGRYVAFRSNATDLVPGDTNGTMDVFVHDRLAAGFTSICDAGTNNVIACPCNNPPSSTGRGCDNSSATGGAALAANGIAYLAQDSLVFTTSGEKPSATSILLQGTSVNPAGVLMGQGVRCVDGLMKRLYVKTAINGSITAPESGAGDASVSARSAALGVPLQAGVLYAYLVYYRDPVVLGGCAPELTYTASQTGTVSWWP